MKVQFTRQPNGNYRFEDSASGRTFEARKTNTGVSWELYEITWYPVADGAYHEMSSRVDGVHETRHGAAEYAAILAYTEAQTLAAIPADLQGPSFAEVASEAQDANDTADLDAGKACRVCGQTLPLASFGVRARAKDHLQAKCRSCRSAYRKARRVASKEA